MKVPEITVNITLEVTDFILWVIEKHRKEMEECWGDQRSNRLSIYQEAPGTKYAMNLDFFFSYDGDKGEMGYVDLLTATAFNYETNEPVDFEYDSGKIEEELDTFK